MSTSVMNDSRAKVKCIVGYLAAALFCFVFQAIYEYFSHDVTSYFMVYAWLIPLIGGGISLLSFFLKEGLHGHLCRELIGASTIWLTLGSIFQGALEIYGTSNRLIIVFPIVGAAQILAAIMV